MNFIRQLFAPTNPRPEGTAAPADPPARLLDTGGEMISRDERGSESPHKGSTLEGANRQNVICKDKENNRADVPPSPPHHSPANGTPHFKPALAPAQTKEVRKTRPHSLLSDDLDRQSGEQSLVECSHVFRGREVKAAQRARDAVKKSRHQSERGGEEQSASSSSRGSAPSTDDRGDGPPGMKDASPASLALRTTRSRDSRGKAPSPLSDPPSKDRRPEGGPQSPSNPSRNPARGCRDARAPSSSPGSRERGKAHGPGEGEAGRRPQSVCGMEEEGGRRERTRRSSPTVGGGGGSSTPSGDPPSAKAPCSVQMREIRMTSSKHVAQVLPNLLLGSREMAADAAALRRHGVTHILNVTTEVPDRFPDFYAYARVPLSDMPSAPLLQHLDAAFRFIDEGRRWGGSAPPAGGDDVGTSGVTGGAGIHGNGVVYAGGGAGCAGAGKVLVHCYYGNSRSASVVIGYLMRSERMRYADALEYLQILRPEVSPNEGFRRQLKEFDMLTFG